MKLFILSIFILTNLFAAEPHKQNIHNSSIHTFSPSFNRIGDYGYPNNPQYDRAIGFLLKGEVKNAVSNNGNFITWDHHPSGFWGEYGYLPLLGFVAGVPGHEYSSNWSNPWDPSWMQDSFSDMLWYSSEAYDAWVKDIADPENEVGNYKTVVYNTVVDIGNDDRGHNDRGDIAEQKNSLSDIDYQGGTQWLLDHELGRLYLFLDDVSLDPNYASSGIGLAYPWAIRPKFKARNELSGGFYFDQYEYGEDLEEWTDDDEYVYYGANTAESWFTRDNGSELTDWQATTEARYNTHNLDNTAGDLFDNTEFAVSSDPDTLLAHSIYPETWPKKYSFDTGSEIPFWPGWWADEYYGESPESWSSVGIYNCNGTRADDGCWSPLEGRHISDMDVYMEFDDRWANVGNEVVDNEYVSSGYPMGIKVMATGHSYEFQIAEDIIFFTLKVRNESGDYCAFEKDKNQIKIPVEDENGFTVCGDGMIMPDGTKLNRGAGFDYQKVSMGFHVDADVLSADASVHTNDDDFMQYIDCKTSNQEYPDGCPTVNGESLRISMAVIGDYDGSSNAAKGYSMETGENKGYDFGVVAVQLLDTPYSTGYVDLDQDGYWDIYPGEKLKMTDWHWFDWWDRPGVLSGEQSSDTPAKNKELIQYQVMAGDNTNLTISEKDRYFHTPDPANDLDSELNPHFDSLEGLKQTQDFLDDPVGLDCVLQITTGPFDLEVGEQVNMSFVVFFGANIEDLKVNAEAAQILYNNHYSMPPSPSIPDAPELTASSETYSVTLSWDATAESSVDYFTNLPDFQGYRIYRSLDGGETWGDTLYNLDGHQVSWQPLIQFDLDDDISGTDPLAPWVSLGDNTDLQYTYTDAGLFVYNDHCYAVTAYDSGLEPGDYDEDWFDFSGGFPSLESSINANTKCVSLPMPDIYNPPADVLFEAAKLNLGISNIEYIVHNDEISGLYKFEIQAEIDTNTFLNSATLNPKLFVYEVDENGYQISEYLEQDFPIYSLYEESGEYEWLDILGMYIRIENLNANFNNNPLALVEFDEIIFSDTLLSDIIDVKMQYSNASDVLLQPYFDYQIEFSSSIMDTAVYGTGRTCDQYEGYPENSHTMLPFKITSLTLNNLADLLHYDQGIYNGQLSFGEVFQGEGCVPVCFGGEICVEGQCLESLGYQNCHWEQHERLQLEEILPDGDDDRIYKLKIGFNLEKYYNHVGADFSSTDTWVEGETYLSGVIVYHEAMLWEATEDISIDNPPDEWFDNNNDNINDNPWQMLYPWEDGDSATIITRKKLHDGDSWLVDMSKIGDDLGNINQAVPNEYSLKNPYPNPFNPVTRIEYSLPNTINVSIIIYDLLGRQVEVLQSEVMNPGNYHVVWDASQFSSGMYFVKMIAGQNIQTQKLMLIK